jgi:hypothetical protein
VKRFGGYHGFRTPDVVRGMEVSLQSGIDEFAEKKRVGREHFERQQQQAREQREAFLRQPCTSEVEREYTGLIKHRLLYEGACELSWEQYSKYRDQHPDCTALTPDDLDYVGMWTAALAIKAGQPEGGA